MVNLRRVRVGVGIISKGDKRYPIESKRYCITLEYFGEDDVGSVHEGTEHDIEPSSLNGHDVFIGGGGLVRPLGEVLRYSLVETL